MMGIAIATKNLKVPSRSRVFSQSGLGSSSQLDICGETRKPAATILPLFLPDSSRLTGWRPRRAPHFRPRLKRTAQSPKACAGHLSFQSRRRAGNPVDTFPGGREGGVARLGCQLLKGPPRWSREAAPGASAGSSAGLGSGMKGSVGSEGPVVGGERGSSKRVCLCSRQGRVLPHSARVSRGGGGGHPSPFIPGLAPLSRCQPRTKVQR